MKFPSQLSLHIIIVAMGITLPICTAQSSVIINEIMYNPSGPEHATEYIELVNTGVHSVDLRGWSISDGTAIDSLVPHHTNLFSRIPSGGYALILDPDYWEEGESWYRTVIPDSTLLFKFNAVFFPPT